MYEAPGKFLLSFASDRSSGSQCATYSPSGSYVLDCLWILKYRSSRGSLPTPAPYVQLP
uniref:Uncharacterized protein n=1 Tax=Arundo donax TaxID=35708 RepID=A0A0A9D1M7_ARUDO